MNRLIMLFVLLISASQLIADTRYVVDELIITVRSGRTNSHQIVKLLRSGAKIDVLSELEDNGKQYAFIEAGDVTGWVLSQYLSPIKIARDRIDAIEANAAKISQKSTDLKKQLTELRKENTSLKKQRDKLNTSAQNMDQELSKIKRVTARPLAIQKSNEKLRIDLATKTSEAKLLSEENATLKNREQSEWFIKGAGVTIGSILFGIILTKIRWRRRSSWGSGSF
ncbi:MAG: TIGR04211 family SH3 domain-containing protein [Sulfuriflexus sp.]|nr:TIGR04211 family SH3 domain-containing protein [Sulfuriflexus sp.]